MLLDLMIIGEGGIRTPEARKDLTVFKTAAFNRSATSPYYLTVFQNHQQIDSDICVNSVTRKYTRLIERKQENSLS
jgi:hypothetical protein